MLTKISKIDRGKYALIVCAVCVDYDSKLEPESYSRSLFVEATKNKEIQCENISKEGRREQ